MTRWDRAMWPRWMSRVAVGALMVLLASLAAHHLGKGLYYLAAEEPPSALADLMNRRTENAYFLDRVSPLSQYLIFDLESHQAASAASSAIGVHGPVYAGGLPPWTYPLQLAAYIPSPLRLGRFYLAGLDIVALGALAWLGFWVVRSCGGGTAVGWTAALSVLAIGASNNTMTQGQNSLLINAALALSLVKSRSDRRIVLAIAAGAALAFAMTKPSSSVLFLLPAVLQRRSLALGTCALVLAAATAFGAWWLVIPAHVQFAQFDRASLAVVGDGANVVLNWLSQGLSAKAARNVLGILGAGLALAAAWRLHRRDPLALFGVLAVVSRLFTYHRAYDDVLIVFLLIAFGARAFGIGHTTWWKAGWVVCGLTLWLPYTLYVPAWAQSVQIVCWMLLAGALTLYPLRCAPSPLPAAVV